MPKNPPREHSAGPVPAVDRRSFLGTLAAGAAAAAAIGPIAGQAVSDVEAAAIGPDSVQQRRQVSRRIRQDAAQLAFQRSLPEHPSNGEEQDYPFVANFCKGLPHDGLGEVEPEAYAALLGALETGAPGAFEQLPMAGPRKLVNPQASLGFDLEGPDSHHLAMRPAPRLDSPENSSEMAELYWMALVRDVRFTDYDGDPLIQDAADDLSGMSDFRGPKQAGQVTPATLFRGLTPGDLTGPYVSQFLLRDFLYGSLLISHRQQTVMPAIDYLTVYERWLNKQSGAVGGPDEFDPTPRYIRNGRDLGQYVHVDALYEAYLNACLILLGMGAPVDPGNPYEGSDTQIGFGTFGGPHILSLVTEVATRALKAVWFQKWLVHRRLRPEEFGGRVHNHVTGAAQYPIDAEILDSPVLDAVFSRYGTYLLPQAFPEGCPLHPAYGSGHATVGGACVTILKAWFDESFVVPDPVVPDADGTSLVPYTGPGALTVGGELNKVAANIASGRNFAGIHWRTDFSEAIKLGEAVAIGILQEQKATYNEPSSLSLTKFDGTTITI